MFLRAAALLFLVLFFTEISSEEVSGPSNEVEPKGFGCPFNEYECDAHCKGLDRKGGYCGGFAWKTCICVTKQSETSVRNVEEQTAVEGADETRGFGCPFNEYKCDSHCKGLGRKGGYCGGFAWKTCICVTKQSDTSVRNVPEETAVEGADETRGFGCPLNEYKCDSHCKGLGRKGGYCGGFAWKTCICVTKQSETSVRNVAEEAALEGADQTRGFGCPLNEYKCDSHCKGLGRKGGYCGGFAWKTCICVTKQSETLARNVAEEAAVEGADETRGFGCPLNEYKCDSHCKGLGRKGGYCGGFAWKTCICVTKQIKTETTGVALPRGFGCPFNEYECDAHCKGLGRKGGYCGGFAWKTCICVTKQTENAVTDVADPRGFGCPFNEYECDAHCKGLGRKGGYCGGFAWKTCICVTKQN